MMIKAVIFDLYETLITEWTSEKYTASQCASDLGVDENIYREVWGSLHTPMYNGECDYEQALTKVLTAGGKNIDKDLIEFCKKKRVDTKSQCFGKVDNTILQMLRKLKNMGVKLILCSNCSEEEVINFQKCELFDFFDRIVFSYKVGAAKPDEKIYNICIEDMGISLSECLFVGDGGSNELYGAEKVGILPLRAMWFLNRFAKKIVPMGFEALQEPGDIFEYVR